MGMVSKKELTLVIPTKTSPNVWEIVREAKALLVGVEVIVVGYQIPDDRKQAILDEGGIFIDEPKRGKGIAVTNAFSKVVTDYVMVIDADGTYPVQAVPQLLGMLQKGADAVVGYRHWKKKGAMTLLHKVGNFGLSLGASILYGCKIKDVCSGMWGFRTEIVRSFSLTSKGFTLEAEFFVNASKKNYKLAQAPIEYIPRKGGKAKVTARDGLKIGWFLVRRRFW